MYTINQLQLKAIKRGFYNDSIYTDCNHSVCCFVEPIMGKTIRDIKFTDNHKPDIRRSQYSQTKGKLFELWRIDGDRTRTLYVITVDSKIYYYTFCSMFAPASAAFETLTEIYYLTHIDGCPVYASLYDATYFNVLWHPHPDNQQTVKRIKNADDFVNKIYIHY